MENMHVPMRDETLYCKSEITPTGKQKQKPIVYSTPADTVSFHLEQRRPIGENLNVTGFDVQL